MIAANYRKFPEAMALQLVLVFGRPIWNTTRPTTRMGRALRQGQAAIVKATPQLVRWVKTATPQWFRDQAKRAKALAAQVQAALDCLVWDLSAAKTERKADVSDDIEALLENYDDTHHGNKAGFFVAALKMDRPSWWHIASGSVLLQASVQAKRQCYPDGWNRVF